MKELNFSAAEVKVYACTANYASVEVKIDYLDEVLDNFTPDEIIKYYNDLSELYDALKECFE